MPIIIHGSSKSLNLEERTVRSTTTTQVITPSEGYDGIGEVTVNPLRLQTKSVTPSTSEQTVEPGALYDGLGKVTVGAVATATQATPSISVSSSGLITASASQSAGYVSAGTKSATKQLTTQTGTTIYPTTTIQMACSAWTYTLGSIYVNGDSNLIASNIKSGVSIFGVTGNYVGTSSSDNKVKVFSGTVGPYSTSRLRINLSENVSEYSLKMVAVAMTKSDANASLDGLISYSRFPESANVLAVGGVYGSSYDEFLVYGSSYISEITSNTAFVLSISSTNDYRKFNTDAQYNYLLVYGLNEIEVEA